ncbi:hypothetical protein SteCoe_30290 [Stentor coeruleus]|uniref:Uncharacterized protein n=1 Tax=Stentor coeruleus TaxID=5963 RepID=A0A1R2B3W9_9CILI|nr:hypothetical protein SteCoe_30290 [Stentor coeruleus]
MHPYYKWNTFADAIWGISASNYSFIQSIVGVLLLASGLVNMKLLAPDKVMGNLKTMWTRMIHSKILFWVFLLPWPEAVFKQFGMNFPRKTFNQVLMIVVILFSVYAKQHRDWAVLQKAKKR